MAGYIGTKASVVSSGAERKKVFDITTTTTSLTGCSYTPNQVHVFHNGVRLVDGTDYTATDGSTVTLTTAAQNGDEVVVISYATFQTSDTVSASAGGTFSNAVTVNGNFTVDTNTLFVDAATNNVGIGTSSPVGKVAAQTSTVASGSTDFDTKAFTAVSPFSAVSKIATMLAGYDGSIFGSAIGFSYTGTGYAMQFATNNDTTGIPIERMRITSTGSVGIGTATPASSIGTGLHIATASGDALVLEKPTGASLQFRSDNTTVRSSIAGINGEDGLTFATGAAQTERARIDAGGNIIWGKTSANLSVEGGYLLADGRVYVTKSADDLIICNRLTNDGNLIRFFQDTAEEGNISVSGTTVSYNGGHLSRWSQTADNTRIDLLKGTVMTNLDQMAVWSHDTTYWTEEDDLPEGVAVGDVKREAYVEDNEQLNCMAVSSVEGDPNVAGVFVNWDNDDEAYTADMNIAMTGDMIIRIAQGTTVQRGDLLMSAGDGTAKPQGDDIVRSKTIAKVTSTHVTCTYEDGSYCVPCVLMAC